MKVILPVINDEKAKNSLAQGFHNANYVCVYDCETTEYDWMPISEIAQKVGNLSLALKQKGIYSIISNEIPFMALNLFIESGLKVYKANGFNLEENIEQFQNNQLPSFTAQYTMEMSGCSSSSCGSCSSSCN